MSEYTPTALITGASSGIGLEFAHILASKGNHIVLVARNKQKLEEIANELEEKFKIHTKVIAVDLSKPESVEEIAENLQEEGIQIDILINNAGFGLYGEFLQTDLDKELEMIDLNVRTLVILTKFFAKEMVKQGAGKIVNVASTAAFQPGPLMAVYYATKAFVLSFSEAIAKELENTGVSVTALCPGPTQSGFQSTANLGNSNLFKRNIPTSEEVAEFGYQAMMKDKRVAIHGFANWFFTILIRFLPNSLVTNIVYNISKEKK